MWNATRNSSCSKRDKGVDPHVSAKVAGRIKGLFGGIIHNEIIRYSFPDAYHYCHHRVANSRGGWSLRGHCPSISQINENGFDKILNLCELSFKLIISHNQPGENKCKSENEFHEDDLCLKTSISTPTCTRSCLAIDWAKSWSTRGLVSLVVVHIIHIGAHRG